MNDNHDYDDILFSKEFEEFELGKDNPANNVSIKDGINYAIDVIYSLNDKLPEPLENPFSIIDDLPKELFLRKFQDNE